MACASILRFLGDVATTALVADVAYAKLAHADVPLNDGFHHLFPHPPWAEVVRTTVLVAAALGVATAAVSACYSRGGPRASRRARSLTASSTSAF